MYTDTLWGQQNKYFVIFSGIGKNTVSVTVMNVPNLQIRNLNQTHDEYEFMNTDFLYLFF